ncbi:MAG: MFS transporter, partial [Ktedonobacteraceae bacterium]
MRKQEAESLSSISVRSTHERASRCWLYGMLGALFVSNAGTALQLATQAWFVWELSHRPATVGLLALVQATPLLGVPLLGGMFADRFPRRRLLLFTQSALTLISALMGGLALAGLLSLSLTLVFSGILASVSALDNPIRQVYLPGVVETAQRGRTVGLNALTYNAGAIVGPAAAGVLLPLMGAFTGRFLGEGMGEGKCRAERGAGASGGDERRVLDAPHLTGATDDPPK